MNIIFKVNVLRRLTYRVKPETGGLMKTVAFVINVQYIKQQSDGGIQQTKTTMSLNPR